GRAGRIEAALLVRGRHRGGLDALDLVRLLDCKLALRPEVVVAVPGLDLGLVEELAVEVELALDREAARARTHARAGDRAQLALADALDLELDVAPDRQ